MQPFIQMIASNIDLAALVMLLVFAPLLVFFTLRAKSGRRFAMRTIPAYERIRSLVSHAAETGLPVHVGMGSGQFGGEATPEALMGLTVFDYVARHAAMYNQAVLGTTGDATILSAAQGALQRARHEVGFPELYTSQEVRFFGPDPLAYAGGTLRSLDREEYLASILMGRFEAEGLWIAESTNDLGIPQVGGTSEPSAAALMFVSLDEAVIGEEVFAAGAYLHRPSHLGSLATQDLIRIITILSIIVGVVMTSLGYWS
jgi:hypothetical protein